MGGKVAAIAALTLAFAAGPAFADGQLAIQSKPSGAVVTLDGSYAGPTPVLLDAPAGRYHIRVAMPGRTPQSFTVTVRDGLTTRRSLKLAAARPAMGELVVRTQPAGATIVLDGAVVGTSPLHLGGLSPGHHRVRAVKDGRVSVSRTVSVHPGLTASVSVGLVRMAPPVVVAEKPAIAPAPKQRPAPRPAIAHAPPHPAAPAPRHVTPPVPRAAAPVPKAPADPAWVVAAPAAPVEAARGFALPDPRPWFFWGLMTLLLAWTVRHLKSTLPRRTKPEAPWHPARGAVGVQAWPGEDAPSQDAFSAVAAMGRGHWQLGLDALWGAIALEPGVAWHYYHMGLALEQLGRSDEAEGAYRTAVQLDPTWAPAAYNLGALLARTGQPAQAVFAYRRLLDAHPAHADGLFNLGHAYAALGNPERAWAHWRSLRKLRPRDPAVRDNLKRLGRPASTRSTRWVSPFSLRRAG